MYLFTNSIRTELDSLHTPLTADFRVNRNLKFGFGENKIEFNPLLVLKLTIRGVDMLESRRCFEKVGKNICS